MLAVSLAVLLFGFVFNVSPGAVFSEALRRGLTGGSRPALLVQLGSLIGDAVWALLRFTGLVLLPSYEQVRIPLILACAVYLARLGMQGLHDTWSPPPAAEDAGEQEHNASGAGAMISLSDLKNVIYWGALGGALTGIVDGMPNQAQSLAFSAGFMLSPLIWCFYRTALVNWLRRNTSLFWHRVSYAGCGMFLLGLAGLAPHGLQPRLRPTPGAAAAGVGADLRTCRDRHVGYGRRRQSGRRAVPPSAAVRPSGPVRCSGCAAPGRT